MEKRVSPKLDERLGNLIRSAKTLSDGAGIAARIADVAEKLRGEISTEELAIIEGKIKMLEELLSVPKARTS